MELSPIMNRRLLWASIIGLVLFIAGSICAALIIGSGMNTNMNDALVGCSLICFGLETLHVQGIRIYYKLIKKKPLREPNEETNHSPLVVENVPSKEKPFMIPETPIKEETPKKVVKPKKEIKGTEKDTPNVSSFQGPISSYRVLTEKEQKETERKTDKDGDDESFRRVEEKKEQSFDLRSPEKLL